MVAWFFVRAWKNVSDDERISDQKKDSGCSMTHDMTNVNNLKRDWAVIFYSDSIGARFTENHSKIRIKSTDQYLSATTYGTILGSISLFYEPNPDLRARVWAGRKIIENALKNVLTNVKAFDTMTPTNVITNVKTQFNPIKTPAHSNIPTRKTNETKQQPHSPDLKRASKFGFGRITIFG